MPKGVEHPAAPTNPLTATAAEIPLMPKGVEHAAAEGLPHFAVEPKFR